MSNKKFSLKFAPKAYEDIEEVYKYISEKLFAEVAANNLLEKIEESVMRLEEFPFSCNYVSDEVLKSKGYRKLIVDNYIVFYIVDEKNKKVVIVRILFGAQKYNDIL